MAVSHVATSSRLWISIGDERTRVEKVKMIVVESLENCILVVLLRVEYESCGGIPSKVEG